MATASPSSASEPRPRAGAATSPARSRGQLSPSAALVAVAAVGMGISLYATVFAGVLPTATGNVAEPTLERVHDTVVTAGVADPARLTRAVAAGPEGYRLRVTLRLDGRRWAAGPTPPKRGVRTAGRRAAVRTGPGSVRAGRLRVEVWQ